MKTLTAQRSILFENRIYAPGEKLPTHNAAMVDAWLSAGTAVWIDPEEVKPQAKAEPQTAEPGLPGEAAASDSEDGENLAGIDPEEVEPQAKAEPQTAEPGLPGEAATSDSKDGENLAGKAPKTTRRKKK